MLERPISKVHIDDLPSLYFPLQVTRYDYQERAQHLIKFPNPQITHHAWPIVSPSTDSVGREPIQERHPELPASSSSPLYFFTSSAMSQPKSMSKREYCIIHCSERQYICFSTVIRSFSPSYIKQGCCLPGMISRSRKRCLLHRSGRCIFKWVNYIDKEHKIYARDNTT